MTKEDVIAGFIVFVIACVIKAITGKEV